MRKSAQVNKSKKAGGGRNEVTTAWRAPGESVSFVSLVDRVRCSSNLPRCSSEQRLRHQGRASARAWTVTDGGIAEVHRRERCLKKRDDGSTGD